MGIGSTLRIKPKHVPAAGGAFRAMWIDLLNTDGYRGRWVALDNVRYAGSSDEPLEADVVDVDDELAGLCARMRERGRTSCCILQCAPRHGALKSAIAARAAMGDAPPVSQRVPKRALT